MGLVWSGGFVRSTTASRWWRLFPPGDRQCCCPSRRRCRVLRLAGRGSLFLKRRRGWWLDRGGACWWLAQRVVVLQLRRGGSGSRGREKSLSACRHRRGAAFGWRLTLLEGVGVPLVHSTTSAGGNPRTSSLVRQRRRVDGAPLEVLLGTRRIRMPGVWWTYRRGCNGCGSSSFCRFAISFISFSFGHCVC